MKHAHLAPIGLTALIVFGSSGCRSVAPGALEPVQPQDMVVPAHAWSSADANDAHDLKPVQTMFWAGFNSKALDALVAEGLAASPSLQMAALRVSSAAAYLEAAAGEDQPRVQASLDATRSRVNYVGLPVPGSGGVLTSTSSNLALGLGVSWEVDLWGRLAAAERGAAAQLDASGLDLIAAHQSLAAQVTKLSISFAQANASAALAQNAVALAELAVKSARHLRDAGVDSTAAELNGEVNRAQAEATWHAFKRRADQIETALLALIGRPAGQASKLGQGLRNDLTAKLANATQLPDMPSAGLPAELLSRRPDLAAAEARIRAAQAGAEVARANLYPALNLRANVGTSGSELKNLLDGDFRVWSLGAGLVAPLLNGDALAAAENQAVAERDMALLAFAASALLAFAEVEQALNAEQRLNDESAQLQLALKHSSELVTLLNGKSQRGTASTAEVLSARANLVQAKLSALATRSENLLNRVDLYLALGGGFDVASN